VEQAPSTLGAKLHDARARRGLSLSQIANSTKIGVYMLEALEANDTARLPGGVYGRGFVRSFAAEVGLDPEAAVAEFVATLPPEVQPEVQEVEPPPLEPAQDNQTPERKRLPRPLLVGLATCGVLIFLIGAPLVSLVGRKRGQPDTESSSRSDVKGRRTPHRLATPRTPSTSLPPLPPPIPSQGDAIAAAASPARPGVTRAPDIAVGNSVSTVGASQPLEKDEPQEHGEGKELVGDHVVVGLTVTRPSWVIATVDAKPAVSRLFQVGEEETLDVRHDLVLTAGDAGAIVLTLNGTAARSIGGTGETVKVRIDRTNFQKYLAPQ
jgi:cytoskeleton protein RodZ